MRSNRSGRRTALFDSIEQVVDVLALHTTSHFTLREGEVDLLMTCCGTADAEINARLLSLWIYQSCLFKVVLGQNIALLALFAATKFAFIFFVLSCHSASFFSIFFQHKALCDVNSEPGFCL